MGFPHVSWPHTGSLPSCQRPSTKAVHSLPLMKPLTDQCHSESVPPPPPPLANRCPHCLLSHCFQNVTVLESYSVQPFQMASASFQAHWVNPSEKVRSPLITLSHVYFLSTIRKSHVSLLLILTHRRHLGTSGQELHGTTVLLHTQVLSAKCSWN